MMDIPQSELFSVLQEFNPWWTGRPIGDLPDWERSALAGIREWIADKETSRALLLTGARQTGKTTLYRQAIRGLLREGYPPGNILYATLDHPLLKLAGLEKTLEAWSELFVPDPGCRRMLFLDEIQFATGWQVWLKHQADFRRNHRIAATGSAFRLSDASSESGVGRWETIPLPTLSFGEFLKLRRISVPNLPRPTFLRDLFDWTPADFAKTAVLGRELIVHFHDYLIRGGFPEPALAGDLTRCQRLLREDIVDKVLKRDLTAIYGVRRVVELEKLFLYLCYHDGGILDLASLTSELDGVNRQLAASVLDLFESTHLIYRLKSFGYGKEVLRGRSKVYLADPAIPGAVMLLGARLLEHPQRLGAAAETAVFKHIFTRYYKETPRFSYWRERKHGELEIDVIAELGDRIVPFEVKYQETEIAPSKLKGLRRFLRLRDLRQGYAITRRPEDLGLLDIEETEPSFRATVLKIPAALACYWLSD